MGNLQTSRLNYQGHMIADKGDMLSLTDMWKAAGSDDMKRPARWLESKPVQEFIEVVAGNIGNSDIISAGRGRNGATFAHWQVGMAYAKYLSPEFHMWCNTQVRAIMEGKTLTGIPADVMEMLRRTDGIAKMLAHKVTEIEKAIPAVIDNAIEARIAADSRVAVVSYVSVKQILENDYKVPAKGRRSIQRKVFVRLSNFCLVNGIKAFKCAHSGTWLFPPHEVSQFVREKCSGIIQNHLDKVKGQGNLKLVQGGKV